MATEAIWLTDKFYSLWVLCELDLCNSNIKRYYSLTITCKIIFLHSYIKFFWYYSIFFTHNNVLGNGFVSKIKISASPISGGAMPSVQSQSAMREPNSTPECIYETHREIQVSKLYAMYAFLLNVMFFISFVGMPQYFKSKWLSSTSHFKFIHVCRDVSF